MSTQKTNGSSCSNKLSFKYLAILIKENKDLQFFLTVMLPMIRVNRYFLLL